MESALTLSGYVLLTDEQKANLSRELGIIVDGELFDPRFDYVFRRIFTADGEKSKKALISFLNAALGLTGDNVIEDLTVINAEIPVDDKRQKKSVFDIRVTFKNGEQAVVEMQFSPKGDFKKRSQFLISKAYASQPLSGEMYRSLKKRYIIS
jgi:predicted transposase/invertase (TIGR01784 family)